MTVMIELKRNTKKSGGTPIVSFIMSERLIAKEVESLYYTSWFNTSHVHVHEQTYSYYSTCSYEQNLFRWPETQN